MSAFQEIDPEEISSFVPQPEDFFWKDILLHPKFSSLGFLVGITGFLALSRLSIAMILEFSEDLKQSGVVITDSDLHLIVSAIDQLEEAQAKYSLAVLAYKLRHIAKDKELRAACLIFFGYFSVQLDKPKQALTPLLEGRQICLENGFEKTLVLCNEILLSIYSALNMDQEAIGLLEEMKSQLEKKENPLDLASTNYTLATAYYNRSEYRKALACFGQAKDILITTANDTDQVDEYIEYSRQVANCYQKIAKVCRVIGKYEQAIEQYEAAKIILLRLPASNKRDLADCNLGLAYNYYCLKQLEKSLKLYQQARVIYQEEGLELNVAFCDMGIADVYDDATGDQGTALQLYEQARLVFEQHGNHEIVQDIDRRIARLKGDKANPLRNDQNLADKETSAKERAISFLRTASSASWTEAVNTVKQGEPLLAELDEEPGLTWTIHYLLAKAYRTQTSLWYYYSFVNPLFRTCLDAVGLSLDGFISSLPDEKRDALDRLMHQRYFDETVFIEAFCDDSHLAALLEERDEELSEEDGKKAAEKFLLLSCFVHYRKNKFESLEKSLKHASSAIKILEDLRAGYVSEQSKIEFMKDKHFVFNLAIDLCLDLEEYPSAFVQIEQAKSRTFVEMLANTNIRVPPTLLPSLLNREQELIDYLTGKVKEIANTQNTPILLDRRDDFSSVSSLSGKSNEEPAYTYKPSYDECRRELEEIRSHFVAIEPEYVSLRQGESLDLQGIQKFLKSQRKRTAVIEFYVGSTSAHVTEAVSGQLEMSPFFSSIDDKVRIVSSAGGVTHRTMERTQLLALVWGDQSDKPSLYRTTITSENLEDLVREASHEIKQQELGANFAELGRQLLDPLQNYIQDCDLLIIIPYGPLHNIPFHALPYQGKTLTDFFEIVYTPSLTVLYHCQNKHIASAPTSLVFGYNSMENDWNNYNNYIEEEAEEVALLLKTQACLGDKATKQAFMDHSKEKRIVHLACHGEFSSAQPMASSVHLAHGERITASEFFSLQLNADLVTLSACETGLAQVISGDELMGFTRSLLYAGAKSVLVSLWRVDNASTKDFMCRFYELLLQGMNKSSALRQVQIEKRDKYEQPFYWSPFILVGDWQ